RAPTAGTLPSLSVPSTSLSRTRIRFARLATFSGIFFARVGNAISSISELAEADRKSLHQRQGPQIMDVQDAQAAFGFVCNHDGGDLTLFHEVQGFAGEHMWTDRLRAPGHAL